MKYSAPPILDASVTEVFQDAAALAKLARFQAWSGNVPNQPRPRRWRRLSAGPIGRTLAPASSNRISVNNPNIKAWTAKTYMGTIECYFGQGGVLSGSFFRREFKNFFASTVFVPSVGRAGCISPAGVMLRIPSVIRANGFISMRRPNSA